MTKVRIYFDDYYISDDVNLLDMQTIKRFLSSSYWANRRTSETIEKSIKNSVCYGVYHENKQIGFARIVTDHATMYWLSDVFIDEDYRGQGIGKKLIEIITTMSEWKDLMGVLGTKDAHELYTQYDFESDTERMMRRMPDSVRNKSNRGAKTHDQP